MSNEKTGYPSIDKPWLKYYPKDADKIPAPERTVIQYVRDCAEKKECMDQVALDYYGSTYTYAQMFKESEFIAKALVARGLREGDKIALCMPSIPETIFLLLGANRLGIVVKMIDPRINVERIKENIGEDSKLVFMIDVYAEKMESITDVSWISVPAYASLKGILRSIAKAKSVKKQGTWKWDEFYKSGLESTDPIKDISGKKDTPAAIIYTSGTTGKPKGVTLSNENIVSVCYQQKYGWPGLGLGLGYSFLEIMPPFIAYGLVCGIYSSLCNACRLILIPKFDPSRLNDLILKYHPNIVMGVPAFFEKMIVSKRMKNADLSFLKFPVVGGDRMNAISEKEVNNFFSAHGLKTKIIKGYGMTELSSCCILNINGDCNKPESCGIPLINTDIMIYDWEAKREKTYGETGELLISGPSRMLGYINKEDEKDIAWIDDSGKEWIRTGDIAKIDEDGNVFIVDRIKRMIIRPDGHNVFPAHIENTLMEMSIIKAVAVVGERDKNHKNGEWPVAFCVLQDNMKKEDARKQIDDYQSEHIPPRDIAQKVIFVDHIPMTSTGKVDYITLKKRAG